MLVIGLTGGIGSGKTAASRYLEAQGITVVDADVAARLIVEPGQPALAAIADHFGAHLLQPDGTLDRRRLREIVFADPAQRQALESITHPAIRQELQRQLQAARSPYSLLVSPLLLETGQHALTHRILLIDAPEEIQLSRTMARDQVEARQVQAIMAAQMAREERQRRADDVITNDRGLDALHRALDQLHQRYLALAAGPRH